MLPDTNERVSAHTAPEINEQIKQRTAENISRYAGAGSASISRRLAEVESEWDIERTLEANAATIALAGLGLGALVDRRFLAVPALVAGFLLQHALQGWCPPVPIFRRLGVRTADEIAREKYALKALRGDFKNVRAADDPAPSTAREVLDAVSA